MKKREKNGSCNKSIWYLLEGTEFRIKTRYYFSQYKILFETYQLICICHYTHNAINMSITDMDKLHVRLRGHY